MEKQRTSLHRFFNHILYNDEMETFFFFFF